MTRRLSRTGAAAVLLMVVVALACTAPAGAHGPVGTMGLEVLPGTAPLTASVRILLEYANDGEVAPGATVTAAATGPDGATVGSVPLVDRGQGRYDAVLAVPTAGTWSVTVTAIEPAATAEATVTVSAAPPSPSATIQGDLGRPDDAGDGRAAADDTDASDRPSPVLLAGIAVVLATAAVVAFTLVRRRTRDIGGPGR